MGENVLELDQIIQAARALSPSEKARLVEEVMATLVKDLAEIEQHPKKSLYGLLADLGPAPSVEDIDEVRKEVWANFPREDI